VGAPTRVRLPLRARRVSSRAGASGGCQLRVPSASGERALAQALATLGVKGILIKAAEQGYITELACKMPECRCPEELGGAGYFEPVTGK
jgi:hypothetical protein